ncbi:hypothetical protein HDU76_005006 [Blyttiomyces sp. JEL0837]|nr:hypothetical protein HDU76_005006 [Blyttiomyces sp. JEL0837]
MTRYPQNLTYTNNYALSSQLKKCNKLHAPMESQQPERLTFQKQRINHLLELFGETDKTTGTGEKGSRRKDSGVADVTSSTNDIKNGGGKNRRGTGTRSKQQRQGPAGENTSANYQYDEYGIRYSTSTPAAYYLGPSQKRAASPDQVEELPGSSGARSTVASSSSSTDSSGSTSIVSKAVASRSNKVKRVKLSIDNVGIGGVAGGIEHEKEKDNEGQGYIGKEKEDGRRQTVNVEGQGYGGKGKEVDRGGQAMDVENTVTDHVQNGTEVKIEAVGKYVDGWMEFGEVDENILASYCSNYEQIHGSFEITRTKAGE